MSIAKIMAKVEVIKEEPEGISEVPNIKYEPNDPEPGQLKISNVFSITPELFTEYSDLEDTFRLPNELMSTSLGIETPNDESLENATSGTSAGYSGPPESIQTYCQLWDKPVCPSEIKTPKQTLRDHLNRDQSRIDPVSLSCEDLCSFSRDKRSMTDNFDDPPEEATTSEKSCPLRISIVQSSNEELREPSQCPSTAKISYQKLKSMRNNRVVLSCDFCSLLFFSLESLEEHVADVHVLDKEFDCAQCNQSFISKEKLDSHMTEHEKGQSCNKCPLCSKTFSKIHFLKRHLIAHQVVRPYKCKLCPQSYVQGRDLENHEMNQHGKEKRFKCSQCSKSFARNCALEDHIRTHSNDKTIICEKCSASFKTKKGLGSHRIRCEGRSAKNKLSITETVRKNSGDVATKTNNLGAHSDCNNKTLVCRDSRESLPTDEKVNNHIGFCQGTNSTQDPNTSEQKKDEDTQPYNVCPICSKTFMSKRRPDLKKHMQTHLNVRPLKCELCPKSYVRRKDLEAHKKSRHGQPKPFKCPKCPKSCYRKSEMQDHLQIHLAEKARVCENCFKFFKTKHILNEHKLQCQELSSSQGLKTSDLENNEKLECLKCPICSKTFTKAQILKQHKLIHLDWKCKLCPKSYVIRSQLEIHEMNQHGKPKRYKCSKCPKSFATKRSMDYHLGTHSNKWICENCSICFRNEETESNDSYIRM